MAFDNICKFICKKYPEHYAAWKVKNIVTPVTIMETELSNEPIRADSVIFLQAQDCIMHIEFQVDVLSSEPPIPLRMLDYWVRLYRDYRKPIIQIVVLLKETPAARQLENKFVYGNTSHSFQIVRIWEEEPDSLLKDIAFLPLAPLAKTSNPEELLSQVAEHVKKIDNKAEREMISSCAQILAGLRFKKEHIQKIFKEGIMRESVIYQEILQVGHQEGHQEGLQKGRHEEGIVFISRLLQRKFGSISPDLEAQIKNLSITQMEDLGEALFDFQSIDDLKEWLKTIN